MTKLILIAGLIIAYSPTTHSAENLSLTIGESFSVPAAKNARIHLSRDGIVSLTEGDDNILLTALQAGQAQMSVDARTYNIRVVGKNNVKLIGQFRNYLKDKMGLATELQAGKVVVFGNCYRMEDWLGLAEIARQQNMEFDFNANWDPDLLPLVQQELNKVFSPFNHHKPFLQNGPPHEIVFPVSLRDQQQTLGRIAGHYGLKVRFHSDLLETNLSVRVQITVAEISRRMQKEIGIEWPQNYYAQVSPKLGGVENIFATLKAMEDRGHGQILASPNLIAKSGAEAEFLAGGEFPIKVSSRGVREVHWKKHGILLKIKPEADRTGRMSLDILTEVSLIDGATLIEGIPGLKTNRMNTKIDLDKSQTVILSGLLRQDQHENQSALPILQHIPILGRLFQSNNYVRMKSELVIFLNPEIISLEDKKLQPNPPKNWMSFDEIE